MNYLELYLPEKQASISFHWLYHSCIKLLTKPSQLVQSCHAAMLLVKCRDVIGQLQLFIPKAGMIITLIAHTEPTALISRMGALNLSDSTPCYSRLQFIQCVTFSDFHSLLQSTYEYWGHIWFRRKWNCLCIFMNPELRSSVGLLDESSAQTGASTWWIQCSDRS